MARTPTDPFAVRILDLLVRLRAGGDLPLRETAPGRGVWRWTFRACGAHVSIDLDAVVSSLRCYHEREELAMSAVPPETMDVLLGRSPVPPGTPATTQEAALAELRRVVADWREGNPRIGMSPPVKVGHPDNWNDA